MQTSCNILRQKNHKKCLEKWIIDFTKDNTRKWDFLTTRMNKHNKAQPTYVKEGTCLSIFGYSIILIVRAIRTILNYISIGEYRAKDYPQELIIYSYSK